MAASEAASSVLRVTSGGKVHGYVERALGALTSQAVRITASGAAVSKAVTVAEITKRRRRGLHQRTQIGLAADAPTVEILLSSEPLDPNLPGYQAPLTDEELQMLFKKCDKNQDGKIDYPEFLDLVRNDPVMTAPRVLEKQPALRPGVYAHEMRKAQQIIKEKFSTKYKRLDSAFKNLDRDRTGTITREELLIGFSEFNLDELIRKEVMDTILDFIDIDAGEPGARTIEYKEFARVLSADDVMAMAPLAVVAQPQQRSGHGQHDVSWMAGAQMGGAFDAPKY